MKWPWETELFEWLYSKYVELLVEVLKLRKEKRESTVYMGMWDEEQPTQGDKPSAHSSLTKSDAKVRISRGFPQGIKWKYFTVANTNSMEPFIDANSIVITERISEAVLKDQPLTEGDICIYKRNDGLLVIHRIMKCSSDGAKYWFKGDNNFVSDGYVNKEDIVYRYVGQIQTRQLQEGD